MEVVNYLAAESAVPEVLTQYTWNLVLGFTVTLSSNVPKTRGATSNNIAS